jgi:DNA-damage-inducible protein D
MENNIFEQIKKINENGQEFWNARDLMLPLGYTRWENFSAAVSRAKESCKNSGQKSEDHFRDATKMIKIATDTAREAEREVDDYSLSRYACYLIAQNGDPRKVEIAKAQMYFAIQTRRQETQDLLAEDRKRVFLRGEMTEHNKKLASAAKYAGVTNHANFQDFGCMGLYGGLRQKDIHQKKKLKEKEGILDHMGSEELLTFQHYLNEKSVYFADCSPFAKNIVSPYCEYGSRYFWLHGFALDENIRIFPC